MDDVISRADQVSTEWLTEVLQRSGALERGHVVGIVTDAGRGNWSQNLRLQVTYTPDAQGSLPGSLFLKMVSTDLEDESFSDSEVTYYRRDYVDAPEAPLLRCYDAGYSPQANRYHLLLEDVSETHLTAGERSPTLEYGLALAEGLAALHARWWGGERLAQAGALPHAEAHIRRFVEIAEPGVEHILPRFTPDLQPDWPQLLRKVFARHPAQMIERNRDAAGQTLIHGDAGAYNILRPRHGERPLYLIDRQPFDWSLTTWLGAYDLAYALVLDWPTDLRRRCQVPILLRYHERLQAFGVTDYPWERLWSDYRLCAAMGVYIAVEYCRGGVNEKYIFAWLPMLQRSLAACEDLGWEG
jgi:hypothetical protein